MRNKIKTLLVVLCAVLISGIVFQHQFQRKTSLTGFAAGEMVINVSKDGYFLKNGDRVTETLQLKRGRIKLIFHYDENLVHAMAQPDLFTHQLTISNNMTGFFLQSTPLSPDAKTAVMEFDVGKNGEKRYDIFCSISCAAMGNLFKTIEVID